MYYISQLCSLLTIELIITYSISYPITNDIHNRPPSGYILYFHFWYHGWLWCKYGTYCYLYLILYYPLLVFCKVFFCSFSLLGLIMPYYFHFIYSQFHVSYLCCFSLLPLAFGYIPSWSGLSDSIFDFMIGDIFECTFNF